MWHDIFALIFLLIFPLACELSKEKAKPKPAAKSTSFRAKPTLEIKPNSKFAKKPDWVVAYIIKAKAGNQNASTRYVAECFNRTYASVTDPISKSFVANVFRKHGEDIVRLQTYWKKHPPGEGKKLNVWAMDLTFVTDLTKDQRVILGIIDHGSRACMALEELTNKSSASILQKLVQVFKKFGIPKAVRMDNEICFQSVLMRSALAMLGIKVQKTNPHSPWQNGRMERFFGTFKRHFLSIKEGCMTTLLHEYRWYYNFARPHQHLKMKTPAESWDGVERATGRPIEVELWDGQLKANYFAPG